MKWLPRAVLIFGLLLLLLSAGAAYYKFGLYLKYGNLASTLDFKPIARPAGLDALVFETPIYPFLLAAIMLIVIGAAHSRSKASDSDTWE